MKLSNEVKAIAGSYARVAIAAALALYLAGNRDLADIWAAVVAAVGPPLYRYLNPNDPAFGRVPPPPPPPAKPARKTKPKVEK